MSHRDIWRQLLLEAEKAGFSVSHTRASHIRLQGHGALIHISSTPSDRRSVRNVRAMIRRAVEGRMEAAR